MARRKHSCFGPLASNIIMFVAYMGILVVIARTLG
jgi:hypothetical protein